MEASDSSKFPAHLSILGLHTEWFSAALSSSSAFSESISRTVSFPEHTPAAVKSALEFCYKLDYTYTELDTKHETATSLVDHFDVYLLADFLMMEKLQRHVVEILDEQLGLREIGDQDVWEIELPELVRRVYENTAREDKMGRIVREVVVGAVHRGLVSGMKLDSLRGLMEECDELAGDLIEAGVNGTKGAGEMGVKREVFETGLF